MAANAEEIRTIPAHTWLCAEKRIERDWSTARAVADRHIDSLA
jgi:hypothetical protein